MKKRQNSDDLELEGRQVINVDGLNFLKKGGRLPSEGDKKLCGNELIRGSISTGDLSLGRRGQPNDSVSKAERRHEVKVAEGSRYPSNCI